MIGIQNGNIEDQIDDIVENWQNLTPTMLRKKEVLAQFFIADALYGICFKLNGLNRLVEAGNQKE